jgi:hypothetical protein
MTVAPDDLQQEHAESLKWLIILLSSSVGRMEFTFHSCSWPPLVDAINEHLAFGVHWWVRDEWVLLYEGSPLERFSLQTTNLGWAVFLCHFRHHFLLLLQNILPAECHQMQLLTAVPLDAPACAQPCKRQRNIKCMHSC